VKRTEWVLMLVGCWLLLSATELQAGQDLRVVASIKPLQAIAAALMRGAGQPELLLPGGASPHSYALRPSQVFLLQRADLVFWIGPDLETFLAKALQSLPDRAKILTVQELPGLQLLPAREGGIWGEDEEAEPAGAEGHHRPGGTDLHVWLSPRRTRVLAEALSRALAAADPERGALYRRNLETFSAQLEQLSADLDRQLGAIRNRPYLVFHDAYHYFEDDFGLHPVGAVAVHPDRPPGARRVLELREEINRRKVRCVFSEPQFPPRLAETLVEGTSARAGVLDPLGVEMSGGADAYRDLMQKLAADLRSCLE